MADARFRSFAAIPTAVISWPPAHRVTVTNHNRLLAQPWADGIKTGATQTTGMVLAAAGQPGLAPLIVITMHEPSREQEVRDALSLFAWGSFQYARRPVVAADEAVTSRPGPGGSTVTLAAATTLSAVVRRGAAVTRRYDAPRSFANTPATATDVGSVTYLSDGATLGTVRLLVAGVSSPSPRAPASPPASPSP
jgi:D-alanyl-D-alanine carboxypeptidase